MNSYLVIMLDQVTGQESRIVVQSDCPHGMQEFVNDLAAKGALPTDNPLIVCIDEHAARHVPIVDPAD